MRQEQNGWRFSGTLVAKLRETRLAAYYDILVDAKFRTMRVRFEKMEAGTLMRTEVELTDGIWLVDGKARPDLHECSDVDIEASPVTNTIPIRRLSLRIGERADLTAAWVRFPSLSVEPLKQSYERLDARRYRYRSASGFSAELEVNSFGLVIRYGDIWTEAE